MRVPVSWLKEYVEFDLGPEALAERLTMAGLEVGAVERRGEGIEGVVVAQILEKGRHPNADRLSLCRVTDGAETYEIVCGATNMAAGDKVALARVGARLPGGFKIKKTKIRGQVSYGMMCSERELGLGEDHSGILILPADAPVGADLLEYLGLPETVIEVEITPNRPDCLSVVGVAREVAALTGAALRVPEPRVPEEGPAVGELTSVEIRDPDLCHRYAARVIRGVRVGPSPLWLRRRLEACGVRSINNVVDVTNYVLLELGHPLHAFDRNRLVEGRIVVQRARDGERFTTLDGQERELDADTLVICDAERPVALAGVMGGENSEVEPDTTDVLLESAWFLPSNIRRTSRRLGLRTEASYRFERGTDIEGLLRALDRATELIVQLAGGTVARGVYDAYPTRHEPARVRLRYDRVRGLLGTEIRADEVRTILTSLGMAEEGADAESVTVRVPTHRVDLEREVDLIEEVARIHGYERIPTTLPRVPMRPDPAPARRRAANRARDLLAGQGYYEAVCLSFGDPADDDRLGLPAEDPRRRHVILANPLGRDSSALRTTLVPGLLRSLARNQRRQVRSARLFEVGRTFHPREGEALPDETLRVAAVAAGARDPLAWWSGDEAVDFFDAKGALETLLTGFGLGSLRFVPAPELSWLHPGRAARVEAEGRALGWVGEFHPGRLGAWDLEGPVAGFEVDLDAVLGLAREPGAFPGLPRYPAVQRDLAILVDPARARAQDVVDAVWSAGSPLVRDVEIFDVYRGERIPEGLVSLALRLTYRADDRTLTDEEVRAEEARVLESLAARTGARLR
ncbi:MAG: phenylalanine--tRNA ligase subunit beta [Candidatus Dadabacteria bacterium]|nr:MAG: phenylalanine--tRNA ligase subunit beta [Candidatus Dadabacteria bacterium]